MRTANRHNEDRSDNEGEMENPFPSDDDDDVEELWENIVGSKSNKIYNGSMVRFLVWVWANHKSLLTSECAAAADLETNKVKFFKSFLKKGRAHPPIHFEALTPRIFLSWIVKLRKKDGEKPGTSSYSSHRSGLFNLFRACRQV